MKIYDELLSEVNSCVGVVAHVNKKLLAHCMIGSELPGPARLIFFVENSLVVEYLAAVRVGNYENEVFTTY